MWGERATPWFMGLLPLLVIAIMSVTIVHFHTKNTQRTFSEQSERLEREYVTLKKRESEAWVGKMLQLFSYNEGALEEKIKLRLRTRIQTTHEMATQIYKKYANKKTARKQIKNALSRMVWEGEKNTIRITDYEGGNILSGTLGSDRKNIADYADAAGRAVILEEIQKVRRHGEGFVKSQGDDDTARITYVKDFGHYRWYFGTVAQREDVRSELKIRMRDVLNTLPVEGTVLRVIFDKSGVVSISEGAQKSLNATGVEQLRNVLKTENHWYRFDPEGTHLYSEYFAPFGWYVLHGFEMKSFREQRAQQQVLMQERVKKESKMIYIASMLSGLFVSFVSLLFSWRMRRIITVYKER